MLPLKDYNPTERLPWVTILLIATNLVVFLLVQRPYDRGLNSAEFSYHYAAIPCELTVGRPLSLGEARRTIRLGDNEACDRTSQGDDAPPVFPGKQVYLAVIYSMFLHGGWLHIGGNMLFLWVFGNNIEDRLRPWWYLVFYLAGGVAATLAHVALQPDSTVPVVGASGAIAAVMGAYLVLFPNAPILSVVPVFLFGFLAEISAKWLLGFWFISQFFISPNSGVAWAAHVGGFVFGALVALAFRDRLRPPRTALGWADDSY